MYVKIIEAFPANVIIQLIHTDLLYIVIYNCIDFKEGDFFFVKINIHKNYKTVLFVLKIKHDPISFD